MTIQDLIDWFSQNQNFTLGYFGGILVLSILTILVINQNNIKSLKYVLSAIVYAVTIPGVLAVLLMLYALLMQRTNILNVSVVTYFVPIIAMVITLIILNRKVKMRQIPGFDKLSSLIIMISIAFSIVFVLQKTYFGVLFIGGISQLFIAFIILLLILKIAWSRLTK